MSILRVLSGIAVCVTAGSVAAQQGGLSETRRDFNITLNGAAVSITRSGAGCPASCLQPMQVSPDVATVGELEVMDFLEAQVASGRGLLLDVRLPEAYAAATIPGAVNVPAATLASNNPYRDDLLSALGVTGGNDFSGAFALTVFSDGAGSSVAAEAVRSLINAGYPPSKLNYYRGGMLAWQSLGLSAASGR